MNNENTNENDLVMAEIEKRNPYIKYDQNTGTVYSNLENANNLVAIESENNEIIYLTREITERALYLQKFACNVKVICILDLLMNFLYLYIGYYFTLAFILCSIGGYISTINYSRKWLSFYLIYQYIQLFFKMSILVTLSILAIEPKIQKDFNNTFPDIDLPDNYTKSIIFSTIIVIIQSYITLFIHKFYRLLPSNETRRMLLTNHN